MIQGLLLNTCVNLVVGLALWLVWRADRAQQFSGWLGGSFLVQAISPLAYIVWRSSPAPWDDLGFWVLICAASASLTLWMVGAAHLAGRPVSRHQLWAGMIGLAVTGAIVLAFSQRYAQAFGATLTTLAALVALRWLYRRATCTPKKAPWPFTFLKNIASTNTPNIPP